MYGWYEPTDRARQLIQNHEYRYISPAIEWTARNKQTGKPQGATLTSIALTNRPFLEEMPQIRLSDPAFRLVREASALPSAANLETSSAGTTDHTPHTTDKSLASRPSSLANAAASSLIATDHAPRTTDKPPIQNPQSKIEDPVGGLMKQVTLSVADGRIKITHEDLSDEYFASPDDLKKCLEEMGLLPNPTLAAREEISVAQAAALFSEAEARGKSVSAVGFFRALVEREIEEAIQTGRVLPRQREDWRKIALSDLATFRKILAQQKPQVPLRPTGFAGAPPEDVQAQVKLLVEQRCRDRQISFGQALTEIGREHPDLVQQYRRAVSGAA